MSQFQFVGVIAIWGMAAGAAGAAPGGAGLPTRFDLRDVDGARFVTSVKSQSGGTCWTHGTMAAVESNLMRTGAWQAAGETGEANLAEYHLDWWNAFNRHWNPDFNGTGGLTVHQGGDYRIAAAYVGRTGGVVRDVDGQSYSNPPTHTSAAFHHYYVRDIEWYTAGPALERIDRLKQAIIDTGAIGTALTWSSSFYSSSRNTFYQPRTSTAEPNHAVTIVGWDDAKATQAPQPGAWLIKNSWGSDWGDGGYFWISYYDKIAGQHDQMGAVSFRGTEPLRYDRIYAHDVHGWRDTKAGVTEAMNVFIAAGTRGGGGTESLAAVSFYTATDAVDYTATIYGSFDGTTPDEELGAVSGHAAVTGFHTVDLPAAVALAPGQRFYVHLRVSAGGHPYDKTSNVPVLLCGSGRVMVESKAAAGESFYRTPSGWVDLTRDDRTANFTIKALSVFE